MLSLPETRGADTVPPATVISLAEKPRGVFEKLNVITAASPIFNLLVLEVMAKVGAALEGSISVTSCFPAE